MRKNRSVCTVWLLTCVLRLKASHVFEDLLLCCLFIEKNSFSLFFSQLANNLYPTITLVLQTVRSVMLQLIELCFQLLP